MSNNNTKDSGDKKPSVLETSIAEIRRKRQRVKFSGSRLRLQIDESLKDPNYFYRWFNDDDDQLGRAERAGYAFVTKKEISEPDAIGDREVHGGNTDLNAFVSRVVGRDRANKPLRAYLMKLPLEIYNEDREEHEREANQAIDRAIRAGAPPNTPGVQNSYGFKADLKYGEE